MKKVIAVLAAGLPVLAFAQTVQTILLVVGNIVNVMIWVVAAIALLVFFWGLVKYIFSGASENAAEGRNLMIWGIVALFVMVSVWGLVRVLSNTFGVQSGGVPILPGSGSGSSGGFGGNVNVNIPF